MQCRAPVVDGRINRLSEIASDAALFVDRHSAEDIAASLSNYWTMSKRASAYLAPNWNAPQTSHGNAQAEETLKVYRMALERFTSERT